MTLEELQEWFDAPPQSPESVEQLNERIAASLRWRSELMRLAKDYRSACKFGQPIEKANVAIDLLLDHAFNGGIDP